MKMSCGDWCVDFLDIILIKVERSFTCSRKTMTIMLMMWLNKKYALFTKKAYVFSVLIFLREKLLFCDLCTSIFVMR